MIRLLCWRQRIPTVDKAFHVRRVPRPCSAVVIVVFGGVIVFGRAAGGLIGAETDRGGGVLVGLPLTGECLVGPGRRVSPSVIHDDGKTRLDYDGDFGDWLIVEMMLLRIKSRSVNHQRSLVNQQKTM